MLNNLKATTQAGHAGHRLTLLFNQKTNYFQTRRISSGTLKFSFKLVNFSMQQNKNVVNFGNTM